MKTKNYLMLGMGGLIPICIMSIAILTITIPFSLGETPETMRFLNGYYTNGFISIIGILAIIGLGFVMNAMILASRYTSKMDNLDEAIRNYENAKDEMETARDKFTELIKKNYD